MKTYLPKANEIERKCYLVDAKDQILGRLAVRIATVLMGKDEPFYTPHIECGDQVVVINAKQIRVTGRKFKEKIYQHYTGYPGGRHTATFEQMHAKNRLADKMLKRLRIYAGAEHRQAAQKPVPFPA